MFHSNRAALEGGEWRAECNHVTSCPAFALPARERGEGPYMGSNLVAIAIFRVVRACSCCAGSWALCHPTVGAGRQPYLPWPFFFSTVHHLLPPAMAEDRPVSTVNSEYGTPAPSLPALDGPLEPPRASFFGGPGPSIGSIASSPRDSRAESTTGPENDKEGLTPGQSTTLLAAGKEEEAPPFQPALISRPLYRRPVWLAVGLGALVAVILAIALPVALTHKSKHSQSNVSGNQPGSGSGNGTGSGNGPTNPNTPSNAITGGDGSTVVSGNTTFVYSNPFGGYCEFFFLYLSPLTYMRA